MCYHVLPDALTNDFWFGVGTSLRVIGAIGILLLAVFYIKRFNAKEAPQARDRYKKALILLLVAWLFLFNLIFFFYAWEGDKQAGISSQFEDFMSYFFANIFYKVLFVEKVIHAGLFYLWFREISIRRKVAMEAAPYELIEEIGKEN